MSTSLILVLVFLYWLPTIIAALRGAASVLAIAATNFFFGWTVIGWIIAFIWSLGAVHKQHSVVVNVANVNNVSTDKTN